MQTMMMGKFNVYANAPCVSLQRGEAFGWPAGSAGSEGHRRVREPELSSTAGRERWEPHQGESGSPAVGTGSLSTHRRSLPSQPIGSGRRGLRSGK